MLASGAASLALIVALPPAAPAAANCVGAEEASAHAAGDSGEEGPPKFSEGFYRRMITIDASLDGADGAELPITIEAVCDVPKRLKRQAAQLAGNDGIALLLRRTTVWQDGTQLTGKGAATAIDGADTAFLRVRLTRPPKWHKDEDGEPIPTFRTGRVDITD